MAVVTIRFAQKVVSCSHVKCSVWFWSSTIYGSAESALETQELSAKEFAAEKHCIRASFLWNKSYQRVFLHYWRFLNLGSDSEMLIIWILLENFEILIISEIFFHPFLWYRGKSFSRRVRFMSILATCTILATLAKCIISSLDFFLHQITENML